MTVRRVASGVFVVTSMCAAVAATTSAAAAGPPTCAGLAAAEPQAGHTMPPEANWMFAADFPVIKDCEWGYPIGGFGGIHQGAPLHHTPVVFVHGNQADAENWFLVADQFKRQAGYTDQELYALSYNGLANAYAGLPTCCQPAPESTAYWQCSNQNVAPQTPACPNQPAYSLCCNGGHGASDDPNTADVYNFITAVQRYTGSRRIDIVAHSLGVTIVRKVLQEHPELRPDVLAAVMIAGGNHGTTVCRGIESTYYGCEEISPLEALPPGSTMPGDPTPSDGWLYKLNASGEAPGPTHWMSVYNGSDNTDPFFMAVPGVFDDTQSPHLDGAVNVTCPHTYHNDERVRPDIVQTYLNFLLLNGQASGPMPAVSGAPVPQFPCSVELAADVPEAPSVPLLLVLPAFVISALLIARRRRSAS